MSWNPYTPSKENPWNLKRIWVLHRRCCFGATWSELQRDLSDGPAKSIDRILGGKNRSGGVPSNFREMQKLLGVSATNADRVERLSAWWMYQLCFSPNPLQEKMALIWHNHFATSNGKVDSLAAMKSQNEVFRERGLGTYASLLSNTIKHPAILKWLDGDANRLGSPNENLGRELLELFTLGLGEFSESDVKEASRALTGWSVKPSDENESEFCFREHWHDSKPKTILGETANFGGDELLGLLTRHPATAKRVAWRLCSEFLSESLINRERIADLAEVLVKNGLSIQVGVETILRSELFFSDANLKQKIIDPESFVVGNVRAFEIFDPPASTIVLADWLQQMGRRLFYPPNVGGWAGGRAWLNSRTTIARLNFGSALVNGKLASKSSPPDLISLAQKHINTQEPNEIVGFYFELLTGQKDRAAVREVLAKNVDQKDADQRIREAVNLIFARSSAQLA